MNGITVVRELASENKHGSDVVLLSMNELTDNNGKLQQHTTSSTDMTGDINAQVEHVVALINEMVSLTAESVTHAQTSSADLDELVKLPERCLNCLAKLKMFYRNSNQNLKK